MPRWPGATGRFDWRGGRHDRRERTVAGGKPRTDPSCRGVLHLTEGTGGVYASGRAKWRRDGPNGRRRGCRRRATAAAWDRPRRNRSSRGGGTRGRGRRGPWAHPGCVGVLGCGGGGLTATNSWRRCGGRRRRRRHRRVDVGLPRAIARRRRERRLRRIFCPRPICFGIPQSSAVSGGARLGLGHGDGGF